MGCKKENYMKKITVSAEEIRMLEIYLWTNPCSAGCQLDPKPRLPKLDNGTYDCYATKENGEYICPLQKARYNIMKKLELNK
jgi:hypothetical protein